MSKPITLKCHFQTNKAIEMSVLERKELFSLNILLLRHASELDGVGPVDNRPSTNKLHHFVPPPKKNDM